MSIVTFRGKHRFHVLRKENSANIFSNTDSGKHFDIGATGKEKHCTRTKATYFPNFFLFLNSEGVLALPNEICVRLKWKIPDGVGLCVFYQRKCTV